MCICTRVYTDTAATKIVGYGASSSVAGNRKRTLEHFDEVQCQLQNGPHTESQPAELPVQIPARLDRESVLQACDASLKRLQVDYIVRHPDRIELLLPPISACTSCLLWV